MFGNRPRQVRQSFKEGPAEQFVPGRLQDFFRRSIAARDLPIPAEHADPVGNRIEGCLPLPGHAPRLVLGMPGAQEGPDGGDQFERFDDIGQVSRRRRCRAPSILSSLST